MTSTTPTHRRASKPCSEQQSLQVPARCNTCRLGGRHRWKKESQRAAAVWRYESEHRPRQLPVGRSANSGAATRSSELRQSRLRPSCIPPTPCIRFSTVSISSATISSAPGGKTRRKRIAGRAMQCESSTLAVGKGARVDCVSAAVSKQPANVPAELGASLAIESRHGGTIATTDTARLLSLQTHSPRCDLHSPQAHTERSLTLLKNGPIANRLLYAEHSVHTLPQATEAQSICTMDQAELARA